MKETLIYIAQTILGIYIDVAMITVLTFAMSVGFKFDFSLSVGFSVWALTMLIRWTYKMVRRGDKR